jgi:transposase-like protein
MKKSTTSSAVVPTAIVAEAWQAEAWQAEAWQDVGASFERFCLTAGLATLAGMMEEDAAQLCGPRYGRGDGTDGYRWGKTRGKVGFHGGKVAVDRPRVRARDGGELALPSWEAALREDLLGQWALNLMLINVSTRKFGRAVRLPAGDIPSPIGAGVSKSATSRRFVALSAERMKEWMAADLSALDLLAIQIDGIHIEEDLILLAAVGIDSTGGKHPLGVIEGASENAAVAQALLDNLVGRGLDPAVCRLFIIDGAKALSKAIRNTFGRHTPIQRCQVHKARNIAERLPKPLHGSVRKALRQAWELDDADKAEKLIRNLARGARGPRRVGQHPGGHRRDPHRHPPRPARRAAPVARLHQHHREHERHHPKRLPQRQALAGRLHGTALDQRRHARSRQGIPTAEGPQPTAGPAQRPGRPSRQAQPLQA